MGAGGSLWLITLWGFLDTGGEIAFIIAVRVSLMQRNHKIKWIFFFTKCASTSELQVSDMLCHTTKTCHFHTTGTSQKKEKRIHICLAHEKMQYYALTHWGIHCNLLYMKNEIFCLWYIVLFFFWWGDPDPFLMSQFPQRKSTQSSLTRWLFFLKKKLMLVLIERYQCLTVFCDHINLGLLPKMTWASELDHGAMEKGGLVWWLTFFFISYGWLGVCASLTWRTSSTRMHYGEKLSGQRQCIALGMCSAGKPSVLASRWILFWNLQPT